MAQIEDNQYNALAQSGDNQNKWMAPQGYSPTALADFFGRFMPRPLAMFLDYFLWIISYVINICLILTILHWTFGIEIGTRIYGMGVLGLWIHGILYCAIFAYVVLK